MVSNLTNAQSYTFGVRAVNSVGEGEAATTTATPAALPGPPVNLRAVPGDGRVTLTWEAAADNGEPITKYQYQQDGGIWQDVPGDGTATSVVVSALTNGQSYAFGVRAVNSVGEGEAATATATPSEGEAVTVTATPAALPGPPVNLQAVPGDGRVTLTWEAAADNGSAISKYQYQQDGGTWQDVPVMGLQHRSWSRP